MCCAFWQGTFEELFGIESGLFFWQIGNFGILWKNPSHTDTLTKRSRHIVTSSKKLLSNFRTSSLGGDLLADPHRMDTDQDQVLALGRLPYFELKDVLGSPTEFFHVQAHDHMLFAGFQTQVRELFALSLGLLQAF